ncbi:methyltransferase domain-containing protein [Phycicoccus avicenniae]|uniref:methyltransferase domain-containing protein n=1 Tax=Phycicoccus avicenniae TaxID=2828860 RepID=UPI003D2DF429
MSVSVTPDASFGRGGGDPYDHAIRTGADLFLHEDGCAAGGSVAARPVEVGRFLARADRAERRLLASTRGSVLDVGCGPGRMVAEALARGRRALGVDVSPASVHLATSRGLPVHHGSVFAPVPGAGGWDVVLLLDGNVGIGGDPVALFGRCRELATGTGLLVVETAEDRWHDRRYTARVSAPCGRGSDAFPWAEVGADALAAPARAAGWRRVGEVHRAHRTFVVLGRRA